MLLSHTPSYSSCYQDNQGDGRRSSMAKMWNMFSGKLSGSSESILPLLQYYANVQLYIVHMYKCIGYCASLDVYSVKTPSFYIQCNHFLHRIYGSYTCTVAFLYYNVFWVMCVIHHSSFLYPLNYRPILKIPYCIIQ